MKYIRDYPELSLHFSMSHSCRLLRRRFISQVRRARLTSCEHCLELARLSTRPPRYRSVLFVIAAVIRGMLSRSTDLEYACAQRHGLPLACRSGRLACPARAMRSRRLRAALAAVPVLWVKHTHASIWLVARAICTREHVSPW